MIMSDRLRIAVLCSGRGSNLQAMIDAIVSCRLSAEIAVVISNKADAPALERARKHDIDAVFVDPKAHRGKEAYDKACLEVLESFGVELVVLAGYMRLLTAVLVAPYRGRIINIHPSLLPAFPGLNAQRQALEYGVKVSGCTVHFVDEQMDHGPIITQATVPVLQDDTEAVLSDRILKEEHHLLVNAIEDFAKGKLKMLGRRVEIQRSS